MIGVVQQHKRCAATRVGCRSRETRRHYGACHMQALLSGTT
jgi:hypothetical protein